MELLQQWQELYNDCKFTLYGIDFESSSFAPAILSILQKSPATKESALYQYLLSAQSIKVGKGDQSGRRKRIDFYNGAREIFKKEAPTLKQNLVTGFEVIEDIMQNPATESDMKHRDMAMAENLTHLNLCDFVCIVGVGHTTLHKSSLLNRFIESNNCKKVALVSMVCRNCYTTSYYGAELIPMFSDYEGKNETYMKAAFDGLYRDGYYSMIHQNELKGLPGGYNKIPTWYVLFKDQPKW